MSRKLTLLDEDALLKGRSAVHLPTSWIPPLLANKQGVTMVTSYSTLLGFGSNATEKCKELKFLLF